MQKFICQKTLHTYRPPSLRISSLINRTSVTSAAAAAEPIMGVARLSAVATHHSAKALRARIAAGRVAHVCKGGESSLVVTTPY